MRFDVVTLFPEIFSAVRDCGITARARMRGLWSMNCWNPRDTATDLHRTIDDRPWRRSRHGHDGRASGSDH